MPSPFPGMDPYLEAQGFWQDFHTSLLVGCREALNQDLPDRYAALIEERVTLVGSDGDVTGFRPDVAITEQRGGKIRPGSLPEASIALVEPVSVPIAWHDLDEITERWIEIRRLPERKLVTVIELLSPTNKAPQGRDDYLFKRTKLLKQPVHLVEIDLLLQGHRIPYGKPLPPGDYYAYVTRAVEPRQSSDVYAWPISHPLPPIPIPLSAPDPDVSLDLGALASRAYDQGRYGLLVNYGAELDLRVLDEIRGWIREHVRPT